MNVELALRQGIAVGQCTPKVMLQGGRSLCCMDHIDGLLIFDLPRLFNTDTHGWFEEIGHGEDGVGACEGVDQTLFVVKIGAHYFGALGLEGFTDNTIGVAGDGADAIARILQQCVDHGASLSSSSADNDNQVGHV